MGTLLNSLFLHPVKVIKYLCIIISYYIRYISLALSPHATLSVKVSSRTYIKLFGIYLNIIRAI